MQQSKTERAKFAFRVEFSDGTPWIILEPVTDSLPVLKDSFLGFDLAADTSIDQANEVAEFLTKNIKAVAHTLLKLSDPI
jgi:hypothetical protein